MDTKDSGVVVDGMLHRKEKVLTIIFSCRDNTSNDRCNTKKKKIRQNGERGKKITSSVRGYEISVNDLS